MPGRGNTAAPFAACAAEESSPSSQVSEDRGGASQSPQSAPCILDCSQAEISVPQGSHLFPVRHSAIKQTRALLTLTHLALRVQQFTLK